MKSYIKRIGTVLLVITPGSSIFVGIWYYFKRKYQNVSKYATPFYKAYHWLASIPPKISWSKKYAINDADKDLLAAKLASGYYIILTGSKHHLSSVMVSLLSWLKTGKWAKYSHVLMNCDNITDPANRGGFKFVEATAKGVDYATFDSVFECDRVCILTPKNVSNEEWTKIIDSLLSELGRPYDDLFDLADSSRLSCVEVVLNALKSGDYADDFKNLDAMIKNEGNLIPQMYRECEDFVVDFEKV